MVVHEGKDTGAFHLLGESWLSQLARIAPFLRAEVSLSAYVDGVRWDLTRPARRAKTRA